MLHLGACLASVRSFSSSSKPIFSCQDLLKSFELRKMMGERRRDGYSNSRRGRPPSAPYSPNSRESGSFHRGLRWQEKVRPSAASVGSADSNSQSSGPQDGQMLQDAVAHAEGPIEGGALVNRSSPLQIESNEAKELECLENEVPFNVNSSVPSHKGSTYQKDKPSSATTFLKGNTRSHKDRCKRGNALHDRVASEGNCDEFANSKGRRYPSEQVSPHSREPGLNHDRSGFQRGTLPSAVCVGHVEQYSHTTRFQHAQMLEDNLNAFSSVKDVSTEGTGPVNLNRPPKMVGNKKETEAECCQNRIKLEVNSQFSPLQVSLPLRDEPSAAGGGEDDRRSHVGGNNHEKMVQDGLTSRNTLDNAKSFEYFDICLNRGSDARKTPVKLNPSLLAKNKEKRRELERSKNGLQALKLRPGMILLKNYLEHSNQVEIVEECRKMGCGPGGFYQPGYSDGAKMYLHMMCLGKDWDPETRQYGEKRSFDDALPPAIPDKFKLLVEKVLQDSHDFVEHNSKGLVEDVIPIMKPDLCIVNFYSKMGKLGLHQDKDESQVSLRKGLPVVSFSIGDSAEFLHGDDRDVDKAIRVTLESGDVLIFGGKSRHIFHGVSSIKPETAPKLLIDETSLRPGRLNLTFRQY